MDLMELRNLYDQAQVQIEVLESKLREILEKQKQMSFNGNQSEFDYISFKISTLEGVIHMYEQYRDQKWTQLQKQSAISLEEIIYGDVRSRSMSDSSGTFSEMEWSDDDISIHMIPSVLTPIRDLEDLVPTPPGSPAFSDMNIFSRNFLDSGFEDFPMTREL